VHDLFLSVDGQDVAHGGFRVMRQVSLSPADGTIGTPITIKVTGLGSSQYNNTIDVRYDNMPVGIITAVTTRGTTEGSIRASGASGKHVIDIDQWRTLRTLPEQPAIGDCQHSRLAALVHDYRR